MTTPPSVGQENRSGAASGLIILGRGTQGVVRLDRDSMTVSKEFHAPSLDQALDAADREFEMLSRFHKRVTRERFLNCPEPLRIDRQTGSLHMTFCSGERLDRLLADPNSNARSHFAHIAGQVAMAADLYQKEFQTPFYGMSAHNIVYDSQTGVVSLYDFHTSLRMHDNFSVGTPVEIGLGRFIGTAVLDSVRPKTFSQRAYADASIHFLATLIAAFRILHETDLSAVFRVSNEVITARMTRLDRVRRLWFRLVGLRLAARRIRLIREAAERAGGRSGSRCPGVTA